MGRSRRTPGAVGVGARALALLATVGLLVGCQSALEPGHLDIVFQWPEGQAPDLAARVQTVITLGSPHQGTAAARGPMPFALRRTMFSRTTIASSTTMPVASTIARRVRILTEKPAT